MTLATRVVIVHRRTEFDELVARHGARRQAAFFLASRGRSLDEVERRHDEQQDALQAASSAIPLDWRRGMVERHDLARFVFGPEDVIVAVGQDGLVANVAKYLRGQVVIGLNPAPDHHPGVLVRHPPAALAQLLAQVVPPHDGARIEERVMVEVAIDDGQALRALNEIFIGHPTHQSARYRILAADGATERQSSSGVLVGTGTGATGWCQSVWRERRSPLQLPQPEERRLCWFVREAWPSPATGVDCTEGQLALDQQLVITAESDLVVFGDGIESDTLRLGWGQQAVVREAKSRLRLAA